MGNLLKLLSRNFDESKDDDNIFIDFENCKPTDSETKISNLTEPKLERSKVILQILENYKGATIAIKEAIGSFGNEDTQKKAWDEVMPLIKQLRQCYEFAVEIAETIPTIMSCLCANDLSIVEHLERRQYTFKQFAEILDFILNFDSLKMMSPSIQNDLSYYRRCCSKRRTTGMVDADLNDSDAVSDEMCSNMSLFYANSTPMLKLITRYIAKWRADDTLSKVPSKTRKSYQDGTSPMESSTECLAAMAKICKGIASSPSLQDRLNQKPTTIMLCLRVMTAVIIIYDLIDPNGVFKRTSKIDVKPCLKILKEQGLAQTSTLFCAIRFSTAHFNDESTPKNVKSLIAECTS